VQTQCFEHNSKFTKSEREPTPIRKNAWYREHRANRPDKALQPPKVRGRANGKSSNM
jgi:hypothetical protein